MDVLLVGEPVCALFRNEGGGRFRDVSSQANIAALRGAWRGCAVGDVDGDGWVDLYLSGFRRCALLRNEGGKTFRDITTRAGLSEDGWGSSAALADLDGDSDLDLVVGHYVRIGPDTPLYCTMMGRFKSGCPPSVYEAEHTRLFENQGAGRYREVTSPSGIALSGGKTLALSVCDYDQDGDLDLYLANDGVPGNLFRNDGALHFTDVGLISGTAYGNNGRAQAGMGVDWADYDRDGDWDLAVTAFSGETYSLYRNEGPAFTRVSGESGIADATQWLLGFGVRFVDLDCDGWSDLSFANGHVYDAADQMHPESPFRQRMLVMQNREGMFRTVSAVEESSDRPIVGRGLAGGDFDNDGKPDLLAVDREGTPMLLRNESATSHHFLGLRIAGPNGFGSAAGARVTASAGPHRWLAQVCAANSYLSSSDDRVLLGLGGTTRLDFVTIVWPGGIQVTMKDVPVDQYIDVTHPASGSNHNEQ